MNELGMNLDVQSHRLLGEEGNGELPPLIALSPAQQAVFGTLLLQNQPTFGFLTLNAY